MICSKLSTLALVLIASCFIGIEVQAQNCGVEGVLPGSTITITNPTLDNAPLGTRLWQTTLYNVTASAAANHDHNKYISAFRQNLGTKTIYYFEPSSRMIDFIRDENSLVILRTVFFNCTDGNNRASYDFRITLEQSDKHSPIFLQSEYFLEISADWPTTATARRSINQGEFIIVGDNDDDLVNAEPEFSTTLRSASGADIIEAVRVPLWGAEALRRTNTFSYNVELYLKEQLSPGYYQFELIATSRLTSSEKTIIHLTVV